MELIEQAKQMERDFESKKAELRDLEIQQGMYKKQFVEQKAALESKNITFNSGAELQAIYVDRQQRLQALIENRNNMMAQQTAQMNQPN